MCGSRNSVLLKFRSLLHELFNILNQYQLKPTESKPYKSE